MLADLLRRAAARRSGAAIGTLLSMRSFWQADAGCCWAGGPRLGSVGLGVLSTRFGSIAPPRYRDRHPSDLFGSSKARGQRVDVAHVHASLVASEKKPAALGQRVLPIVCRAISAHADGLRRRAGVHVGGDIECRRQHEPAGVAHQPRMMAHVTVDVADQDVKHHAAKQLIAIYRFRRSHLRQLSGHVRRNIDIGRVMKVMMTRAFTSRIATDRLHFTLRRGNRDDAQQS